jgi:BlaI family transcriptional regulator, penicillinase repressor
MKKQTSLPLLTRGETDVMRVLWKRGQATVGEIVEEYTRPIAYTTVLTVLRVLEEKGYVTHDKELAGRAHVYRPALDEERARRSHLRDLLDRMFAGRPDEMVNGLIDNERLTRADLEALRRRIDEKLARGKPRGGK